MKHIIQSLAMAAALAASSLSSAATITTTPNASVIFSEPNGSGRKAELQLLGGSGALEFSNGTGVLGGVPTTSIGGLVGALNVGKVVLTAVDNAVVKETIIPIGRATPRGLVSIAATVSSLTLDDQTGQVLTVGSLGGAQQDAAYLEGVLDGGRMTVRNLRFDLANKTVYADLSGQLLQIDDTLGPVQTSLNTALWTITSVTGPTALEPGAFISAADGNYDPLKQLGYTVTEGGFNGRPVFSATNILGGLKVTTEGFNFFAASLGLTPGSTGYTTLAGVNGQPDGWGSIQSTINIVGRVPEPGTYALMGLGLIGIARVAKRRLA